MTKATFDIRGNTFNITIEGHAGHEDPRVCASASMLACTLIEAMRRAEADGYLIVFSCEANAGDVTLQAVSTDYGSKRVQAIVDTIIAGYDALAGEYPENVQVIGGGAWRR